MLPPVGKPLLQALRDRGNHIRDTLSPGPPRRGQTRFRRPHRAGGAAEVL